MSEQDDQIFLKRFSMVIAGLAVFAVLLVFAGIEMNNRLTVSENVAQGEATLQRIEPIFDVYAGDSGRAAAQAAAEMAGDGQQDQVAAEQTDDSQQQAAAGEAAGAEPQQVAFGGSTDGEMIYNNACQACHMSGAAGAPQLVAAQWDDRLDKGKDTLVSHAINGFNAMPARGGRSDLSDEQVRASVEYMLAQIE